MDDALRTTRGRAFLLAGLYVGGWLLALLGLMGAELLFDPDFDSGVGEFFDNASVVVWIVGAIAVPIGTTAIFRALEHSVRPALTAGVVALLVYCLGTAALLAIYSGVNT